jgi:hypothetical protein
MTAPHQAPFLMPANSGFTILKFPPRRLSAVKPAPVANLKRLRGKRGGLH